MSRVRIALLGVPSLLVLFGNPVVSAGESGKRAVPLPEGALARVGTLRLRHNSGIQFLSFLADGRSLVSISEDDACAAWDTATGRGLRWLQPRSPSGTVRAQLDPQLVARVGRRRLIRMMEGRSAALRTAAVSPDGALLAVCATDGVHLWDTEAATRRKVLPVKGGASTVTFAADGKYLAASGAQTRHREECLVYLWETATGKELKQLKSPAGQGIQLLLFSPNGTRLAGATEGEVRVWDLARGKRIRTYQGHSRSGISALAFSPDGKRLASAGDDRTILLWEESSEEEVAKLTGPESEILALAFSPDGKTLASGDGERLVRLWDLSTGRAGKPFGPHPDAVTALAYSPNGKTLAVGGRSGHIRLWDPAKEPLINKLNSWHVFCMQLVYGNNSPN